MIARWWILLRMGNVSDKSCEENQSTHFMFNNVSPKMVPFLRCWKYGIVREATDDTIIRRVRFACWITKATETHSEYVMFIVFPRRQWLRERPSMLYLFLLYLIWPYVWKQTSSYLIHTRAVDVATLDFCDFLSTSVQWGRHLWDLEYPFRA
jgi:hypothetical protein